jgi:hypothetical protein
MTACASAAPCSPATDTAQRVTKTVTIDHPVWMRDTYQVEIPNDIDPEELQSFIEAAIDGVEPESQEDIGQIEGMSRQFAVEGRDI